MIGHILLTLAALTVSGFLLLVLIGLWDRYEHESGALGFSGIYERDFPSQVDPAEQKSGGEQLLRQQGPKLVGTGAVGSANQGMSVALSADGNTAIVGGPGPSNGDRDRSPSVGPAGAAWVFVRSGDVWTQQDKLVGTTDTYGGGLWSQGMSVALSADGNTAIVGGPSDNRTTGAAWVFTRNGGVWTQQGSKLVGTGAHLAAQTPLPLGQGMSVALSADGNTAIVGGWGTEAAWIFTRSGGVWTQQGNKMVGSGAVGSARQGMSVALSADGITAIVGGWSDNSKAGAAWVFVRSGDVWVQQGKKLVATDAVGSARQGTSVALSADGNTAIVGGPGDNPRDRSVPFGLGAAGAAWVFTRIGGVWTQQGNKLVGSGTLGRANQGTSVALSADGDTAIVGGFADDGSVAGWRAWVFTRSDGHWKQEKNLVATGIVGKSAPSVALSNDGSTIIVGGSNDNGGVGAAWVFRRSGGEWTQDKYLVDTEPMKKSAPSVALSAEGGSAIGGDTNDSGGVGAALVSAISGGGSTQQEPPPSPISSDPVNWEE
jgi:FG-GAP repeat